MKSVDLNLEKLRQRLLTIFGEHPKATCTPKMKEVVKEYDEFRELLDETLNIALGIMDAICKNEIKDKKEEESYVKNVIKELENKSYVSGATE
ncbi:hypothetical protein GOV14_01125 [Candidatus Pacearchaeota archaeon]|nr:hypothetical protein [Candidatus Pacearchaeota archaeon]